MPQVAIKDNNFLNNPTDLRGLETLVDTGVWERKNPLRERVCREARACRREG